MEDRHSEQQQQQQLQQQQKERGEAEQGEEEEEEEEAEEDEEEEEQEQEQEMEREPSPPRREGQVNKMPAALVMTDLTLWDHRLFPFLLPLRVCIASTSGTVR